MKRYNYIHTHAYGWIHEASDTGMWVPYKDVEAAIKAAVLAEREACAALAEHWGSTTGRLVALKIWVRSEA